MNYLENNIDAIRQCRPGLLEQLEAVQPIPPVRDKNETPKNAGKAVEFLGDFAKEGVFVLMGLGMGYLAKTLVEKTKESHLIIAYEPSVASFKYVLQRLDLTKLLSSPKVYLLVGDVDSYWFVHQCHTRMINGRLWVIQHKNFLNGGKEKCKAFYDKFVEEKRVADINMTTQIGLGKTFMNAIMDNIPHIITNNGVISLQGIAKGKPVVSVGAGPFLERNVDKLKEMKGKAMIICVDVALPYLLSHDIVPDIVTGIDPLNDNCALFRDERVKNIPLVCMSQYTHKVIKEYPGKMFFSSMPGNQVFVWLQWYWDEKGHIDTFGGSVSHFSFALAEYMGADPIVLMGHDFAFKKNYYIGNADRMLYDEAKRTDPFPDETKDAIEMDNMYGEKVFVKQILMSFKTVFENKINTINNKVINLSYGGLTIKGTEEMTAEKFIGQYCKEDIDYPEMFKNINNSNGHNLDELIGACKTGRAVFKRIRLYSKKITDYIHKAMALRSDGNNDEARAELRKLVKIQHNTIHPLLEIMSGYHTILEIYLQRQDIQDIDTIEDEWVKRDSQMMRGLNYYGELIEAIDKFIIQLNSLIKDLTALRKKESGISRPE